MKTRLALSMRVTSAHNYDELRDSISHDWLMLCQEWNYEIVLVPNYISDPVQYINQFNINGLILTGGDDIGAHQIRDQTEIEMLKYAINKKLPIKFIIEDNSKSVCTDTRKAWSQKKLTYEKFSSKYVYYYKYHLKYPHAGAGKRVQF